MSEWIVLPATDVALWLYMTTPIRLDGVYLSRAMSLADCLRVQIGADL